MPATYEPIATTTLGSDAALITFSSISGSYTDLRLIVVAKGAGTQPIPRIRLNSDTGTNYSNTNIYAESAASKSSGRGTSQEYAYVSQSLMDSTQSAFYAIDFFSYSGNTNKTFLVEVSSDLNGSGWIERVVNLWRNTAAITTIQLSANLFNPSGLFASGTTATLYGILKA